METHDAMYATYQILLHNSLWFKRSTRNQSARTTKSSTTTKHTTTSPKSLSKYQQQRKNIMRISKYNMSNRCNQTIRAPNNSPKRGSHIGWVSLDTGGSKENSPSIASLQNRCVLVDNDETFMNSQEYVYGFLNFSQ